MDSVEKKTVRVDTIKQLMDDEWIFQALLSGSLKRKEDIKLPEVVVRLNSYNGNRREHYLQYLHVIVKKPFNRIELIRVRIYMRKTYNVRFSYYCMETGYGGNEDDMVSRVKF